MENNREKLSQAADLLRQASDMIRSIPSGDNTASRTSTSSSTETTTGTIAETLSRARSMMATSANAGLYRRLNRNERLRAVSSSSTNSSKNKKEKKSKSVEKKPIEFGLLKTNSADECDEEEEDDILRKENIVERGMVVLTEDDEEKSVRAKLVSSLKSTYSILGPNDFEFVKVTQKKL